MFSLLESTTVFVSGGQFCIVGSKIKNLENTPTLSCWSLDERLEYTSTKNLIADKRSELSELAKYLLFLNSSLVPNLPKINSEISTIVFNL